MLERLDVILQVSRSRDTPSWAFLVSCRWWGFILVVAANIIRPWENYLVLKVMGAANVSPLFLGRIFWSQTRPLH